MNDPQCAICLVAMEPGFLPDTAQGGYVVPVWVSGIPEKSFWMGLKLPARKIPVMSYRCPRCGKLELFAR